MSDFINEFAISKTRSSNFESCQRKYYYRHYGFWDGWNESLTSVTRELWALTKLNSRPAWVGLEVHGFIDELIEHLKQGTPIEVDDAVDMLRRKMLRKWKSSSTVFTGPRFLKNPKTVANDTACLLEHYYNIYEQTQPDDLNQDIGQATKCIRNFYQSSVYKNLTQNSQIQILEFRDFASTLVDGIKVSVQIDLALQFPDGRLQLIDWKTGKRGNRRSVLNQLMIYGVYAVNELQVSADNITLIGIDLFEYDEYEKPFDNYWYQSVVRTIELNAAVLQEPLADVENNIAHIESFPKTTYKNQCRSCPFQGPCGRDHGT